MSASQSEGLVGTMAPSARLWSVLFCWWRMWERIIGRMQTWGASVGQEIKSVGHQMNFGFLCKEVFKNVRYYSNVIKVFAFARLCEI